MKAALYIIVYLLPLNIAFAQLSSVGATAGASVSNFDYQGVPSSATDLESNDKVGGTAGIRLDFKLKNEYVRFSPELFVIQNGSKQYYSDFNVLQNDLVRQQIKLDYIGISLPLTINIPIGDNSNLINAIVLSGCGFADYAFGARISDSTATTKSVDFKKNTEKIDLGVSLSGGLVFNSVFVKFGYNFGLKNIEFYDPLKSATSEKETFIINNKGFTLSIGFLLKTD